jgi:prophage tail gpP-like protein
VSNFSLNIGGVSYSGFETIDIYKSMLIGAGTLVVSLSNYKELSSVKIGDSIVAEIDGQKVLTGIIDKMPVMYGKNYNRMDIGARDKTCDLVDCSFNFVPNEWKKQTVENIIKNLCNPFSVSVSVEDIVRAETNIKIDTYKANEGQSVFEDIAELCRDYAILPVVYGDGKITLTKVTSNRSSNDGIIQGVNVEACYSMNDNENRYSDYIIKGQGIGNDNKELNDYISCSGKFSDPVISRVRPMIIFADLPTTLGGCQKRAKWEARIHAGLSRAIEYQIPGWVQSNNKIWEINSLVPVQDSNLKEDATKLVLSIRYHFERSTGEISKITVVDKDTFNLSSNVINIKSGYDD